MVSRAYRDKRFHGMMQVCVGNVAVEYGADRLRPHGKHPYAPFRKIGLDAFCTWGVQHEDIGG